VNKKQERAVVQAALRALNTPAARETEVKRLPFRATFIAMLFTMFGGLAGLSLLTASPSSANESTIASVSDADSEQEPPSCDGMNVDEGTGECADVVESESHSRSSSKSRAVSVNGVSVTSRVTVLARIRANGTPPAQQNNCFRTNRPMSLYTSYNAEGTTGWWWKPYPSGYRFCRVNGVVRDPKCHNQVKIGVPKSKPPKNTIRGEVKFVKRLRWHVKAVAKADEKVTSEAKAWCTTQSAYAYGEGRGSASAYAVGRASARGSILVKLRARVRAMAQGDLSAQLGGKSVIKVKAEVRATAFTSATSEAHAKAVCKDTPPPPPPPPSDTPPQISCTWQPHVFEKGGNVYGWCETIDPDGDVMSLNVEVDAATPYAHISGVVPSDVRWDGTACPAGTKCWRFTIWGDSPGFAKINATVTAGGKSAVSRGTIEVKADEF
jgi:hypothetical protein